MSKEEYIYIIKNYAELMNKYPDTRERALKKIDYVTSVNISKIIALKGCKNCINIVSTKLDVKESDLCKNCQNLLAEHKL